MKTFTFKKLTPDDFPVASFPREVNGKKYVFTVEDDGVARRMGLKRVA